MIGFGQEGLTSRPPSPTPSPRPSSGAGLCWKEVGRGEATIEVLKKKITELLIDLYMCFIASRRQH